MMQNTITTAVTIPITKMRGIMVPTMAPVLLLGSRGGGTVGEDPVGDVTIGEVTIGEVGEVGEVGGLVCCISSEKREARYSSSV